MVSEAEADRIERQLAEAMKNAIPHRCRMCESGRHTHCTGIGCWCLSTKRCAKNAALTEDRYIGD